MSRRGSGTSQPPIGPPRGSQGPSCPHCGRGGEPGRRQGGLAEGFPVVLGLSWEDAEMLRVAIGLLTPAGGGWFDGVVQAEARQRLLGIASALEAATER